VVLLLAAFFATSCKRGPLKTGEYGYVAAQQVVLRDRVATVYNKVGTAKNGEQLEILEHQKRFVRVRTPRGEEGWVEQRNLVEPEIYNGFQKLLNDNRKSPVQGKGKTRVQLNMHLTPARDGEALYQLAEGDPVDILARATSERLTTAEMAARQLAESRDAAFQRQLEEGMKKAARENEKNKKRKSDSLEIPQPTVAPPPGWDEKTPPEVFEAPAKGAAKKSAKDLAPKVEPPKPYDDWWLVRSKAGRVGWVLARMIDLDVPLEIAQYAEGQRVMGAYVLSTIKDDGKGDVPQYLVVLNEPKDGSTWDFDQIRVFTWNTRRHRYETAYREHNLIGFFPVRTATEDFGGKEGVLPIFEFSRKNEDGTVTERKYRMIGPIVREVKGPGEQPKSAKISRPPKAGSHKAKKKSHR